MVESWLPDTDQSQIRAVGALVTGLRAQLCAAEPISLDDAGAATAVLSG